MTIENEENLGILIQLFPKLSPLLNYVGKMETEHGIFAKANLNPKQQKEVSLIIAAARLEERHLDQAIDCLTRAVELKVLPGEYFQKDGFLPQPLQSSVLAFARQLHKHVEQADDSSVAFLLRDVVLGVAENV